MLRSLTSRELRAQLADLNADEGLDVVIRWLRTAGATTGTYAAQGT
jgi:hypothetical protein